jgi:hypothetical protein
LPSLPAGTASFGTQVGIYERNSRQVAASAAYMRARADQAAACAELIAQREMLGFAIARLHSLPERCQHEYEKGRLERLNELELLRLQHELDVTNKKIEVAQASTRLVEALPIPVVPASSAPQPTPAAPPPSPASGISAREAIAAINEVAAHMPDISPETREHLALLLSGYFSEKSR